MKASVRWINECISAPLPVDQIVETLTRIGHEVDDAVTIGELPDSVVLGHVLEVEKHPDADRLSICKVSIGQDNDQVYQIICGAPNVASGQFVAVALPGTTLPIPDRNGNPLTIAKAKIRGVESNGMICAEDELGLGVDHSGIMILNDKVSSNQLGTPISTVLSLRPDTILDIGLTPNRPDAACHAGLARDLAAATEVDFLHPFLQWQSMNSTSGQASDSVTGKNFDLESTFTITEEGSSSEASNDPNKGLAKMPSIEIRNKTACPRYTGVVIEGVKVKESPEWLTSRLESLGLRSVNNVVDVTNEILHEIGQPLHAFDMDTFSSGNVTIQSFDEPVSFTTLDHVKRDYPAGTLFICDGDTPVALAGIMGGEESEVTSNTTTIFLESAYFEPSGIRKSAKLSGLQTDASYRFERGVDPELSLNAALYAAKKITEVAGGQILPLIRDLKTEYLPTKIQVSFRPQRAEQILGTALDPTTIRNLFSKLEIQIMEEQNDGQGWLCEIPTFRPDITREIDLIEEVGRLMDYNTLPVPSIQRAFVPAPIPAWESFKDRVRIIVSSLRYQEIVTNSLLSAQAVQQFGSENEIIHTLNPVSQDAVSLRSSLLSGFTQTVRFNANREADSMRFFEIGQIYSRTEDQGDWVEGIRERTYLQMGVAGDKSPENWRGERVSFSFHDLKEDLNALFRALGLEKHLSSRVTTDPILQEEILIYEVEQRIVCKGFAFSKSMKKKLDLDLPLFAAEIDLTACFEQLQGNELLPVKFKEPSKFPPFSYDAAFIVEKDTAVMEMTDLIYRTADHSLLDVQVFDLYEGESIGNGKKSVAFRMTFLDRTKTLSSSEVEPVIQKIVKHLNTEFSAVLRS